MKLKICIVIMHLIKYYCDNILKIRILYIFKRRIFIFFPTSFFSIHKKFIVHFPCFDFIDNICKIWIRAMMKNIVCCFIGVEKQIFFIVFRME